jgi:hypothetical protein
VQCVYNKEPVACEEAHATPSAPRLRWNYHGVANLTLKVSVWSGRVWRHAQQLSTPQQHGGIGVGAATAQVEVQVWSQVWNDVRIGQKPA